MRGRHGCFATFDGTIGIGELPSVKGGACAAGGSSPAELEPLRPLLEAKTGSTTTTRDFVTGAGGKTPVVALNSMILVTSRTSRRAKTARAKRATRSFSEPVSPRHFDVLASLSSSQANMQPSGVPGVTPEGVAIAPRSAVHKLWMQPARSLSSASKQSAPKPAIAVLSRILPSRDDSGERTTEVK